MLKQIVIGFLIMALGAVVIYFSHNLVEMFGRNARAERNLGGTRAAIVLVGFFVIMIGGLILFGVIPTSSPVDTPPSGFGNVSV